MTTYILGVSFAALALLLAALISEFGVPYKGGQYAQAEKRNRRIVFWIFFALNPVLFWVIAASMTPSGRSEKNDWNDAMPIAAGIGVVSYLVLGFILAKVFKNGKIGNWF
jgi:sulfoxide reductase heme-binding subunit YedZ